MAAPIMPIPWNVPAPSSVLNAHPMECSIPIQCSECPSHGMWGQGGDSSVVRALDSLLEGRGFESLLERRENFFLQGQLSVLTLITVSVPLPCYRSST